MQRNIVLCYATGDNNNTDTFKERSQRPVTSETFDDGTAPNKKKTSTKTRTNTKRKTMPNTNTVRELRDL